MPKLEEITKNLLSIFEDYRCYPLYFAKIAQIYHLKWSHNNRLLYDTLEKLVAEGKIDKVNKHYGLNIVNLTQFNDPTADYAYRIFNEFRGKALRVKTVAKILEKRGQYSCLRRIAEGRTALLKKGIVKKLGVYYGIPTEDGSLEEYDERAEYVLQVMQEYDTVCNKFIRMKLRQKGMRLAPVDIYRIMNILKKKGLAV